MSVTVLLVLYGLVVLTGVGAATAAYLNDRRLRPGLARQEIGLGLDLTDTALLSGGVARAVDAVVVDLAERGLVVAEDGKLTVTAEVDAMLDTPMDSPAYKPEWDFEEAMILVSARAAGRQGLDAVRRHALKLKLRGRLYALARRALLITPLRRQWGPMTVAGPTLLGMFFCTIGMMTAGPIEEIEGPTAIAVLLWLPVTIATVSIWSRRPGYHGPDPRTALGRDVVELLRSELRADATQARRVAVGGFAAMTDDALRRAVKGDAVESRWSVPGRRRSGSYGINALLAGEAGMSSDGGDGGGDGGGGGD